VVVSVRHALQIYTPTEKGMDARANEARVPARCIDADTFRRTLKTAPVDALLNFMWGGLKMFRMT
jgi:hypothetical protein